MAKHYRVMINGVNFLMKVDDELSKLAFYANCFVKADDPDAAGLAAIQTLRDRKSLRDAVQNPSDDPPEMFVEEIEELPSFDHIENLEQGLIWYDPTEEEEE
ncbi:MAG: hypothetical protein N2C14_11665 [Planctomycetales bacterium]